MYVLPGPTTERSDLCFVRAPLAQRPRPLNTTRRVLHARVRRRTDGLTGHKTTFHARACAHLAVHGRRSTDTVRHSTATFPTTRLPVTESTQATPSRARPTAPLRTHGASLRAMDRSVTTVRVPASRLQHSSSPRSTPLSHAVLLQAACVCARAGLRARQLRLLRKMGWTSSVRRCGEGVMLTSEQASRAVALHAGWCVHLLLLRSTRETRSSAIPVP